MGDNEVEILGMSLDPWVLLGLLVFSLAVTLVANWLVARFRQTKAPSVAWPGTVAASLIWIALVFVAGIIATRYIERITTAAAGYLVFGLMMFLLSLLRAWLYQRGGEGGGMPDWDKVIHELTYLLFATVIYLILGILLQRPVELVFFIPLYIGALLPNLDSRGSVLGRLLPFISRRLEGRLGHRQEWHTPASAVLLALGTIPLILLLGWQAWCLVPLGFFSHLVLDMLSPQGIMLFWPITHKRYSVLGGPVKAPGGAVERLLVTGLIVVAVVLFLVVDFGPAPPPPAAAPSYEQSLDRYYSTRGRNLVFANIGGSWQATGRQLDGYFEILNASGRSFLVLDRYTGKIFTAGRSASDNFYLNRISLVPGDAARIKPVEVRLQGQRLGDALPTVYEMQREPGLQYIYVSGDVIVPIFKDVVGPGLRADYAQTGLRKIQAHDTGHYSLHYLTASELIELANLEVETADLVIVATYVSPATGPTVTPLPSPPPMSGTTP